MQHVCVGLHGFSLRPGACVGHRDPVWECHRARDAQRQAACHSGDVRCGPPLQQRCLETHRRSGAGVLDVHAFMGRRRVAAPCATAAPRRPGGSPRSETAPPAQRRHVRCGPRAARVRHRCGCQTGPQTPGPQRGGPGVAWVWHRPFSRAAPWIPAIPSCWSASIATPGSCSPENGLR